MNGHSVAAATPAQALPPLQIEEREQTLAQCDPFALAERAQALSERFFLWQSTDRRRTLLGAGELVHLTADGEERFAQIAARWRSLGLAGAPSAMLFGGFAFDDAPPGGPFQGLHAGDFFVPKLLVREEPGVQRVVLFSRKDAEDAGPSAAQLLAALLEGEEQAGGGARLLDLPGARRAFARRVSAATQAIAQGAFEKVVLARRRVCLYDRPPALRRLLSALSEREADCRIFAFGDGRRVFLGATPELLCRCEGSTARVDCLAGSAPRGATPEEDAARGADLLASAKNLREHAHVVDAVRRALEGLGLTPAVPKSPRLRRLTHVQHLYTPVSVPLGEGQDLFRLAQALHPTPAVGGAPRDAALAWRAANEGLERGFYAGAVGWADASGDGEFDVALRSALLLRRGAWLYAGCGIVEGSDPAEELRESEVKMRPLATALRRDG